MRIERVEAHAFGAIRQQALELAPGMTVVYGQNEAGKSTWHDAIYAAICGIRRGRGARKEDREFKQQRQPWSGDRWSVSCRLVLEEGRRIEINRDLEGKVDDEAIDTELGRDVSTEIINDGAPDASLWLGLDRKAFLSTACIRQGDVLGVAQDADELQEQLEKAAATAGTDATAARALEAIDTFHSAHVGLDRANSTRPLRAAINNVENARESLADAKEAHNEYLDLDRDARELEQSAERLVDELAIAKAMKQSKALAELKTKVARARELSDEFPDGAPPNMVQQDDLAQSVTESITRWHERPIPPDLSGDSSEDLEAELALLPEPEVGDTTVASDVRRARDSYVLAVKQLESHDDPRSSDSVEFSTSLSASQIRDLAQVLSAGQPSHPSPDTAPADGTSAASTVTMAVGAVITVVGLVGVVAGSIPLGIAGIIAGLIAVGVGFALRGRTSAGRPTIEDIAREIRAQEALDRYEAALASVKDLGLPMDPSQLDQLANQAEREMRRETDLKEWEALQEEVNTQTSNLESALADRGVTIEGAPQATFANYEAECTRRAEVAIASARRPDLEARLDERRTREADASSISDRTEAAATELRSVAVSCNIDETDPDVIVTLLESWLADRQEDLADQDHDTRAWAELEILLGNETLPDLEVHLSKEEQAFASLGYSEEDLENEETETSGRRIADIQQETDDARRKANAARGRAVQHGAEITSVAQAEEERIQAEDDLTRVRRLESLLTQTRTFLKDAEDKAHRTIAPKLKADLEQWLPTITEGRHTEVAVDVETLEVQVKEADGWQPATLLSHGTAEQLYLLLRIAMVDHLVGDNGSCPLLIDDVTVQSDADRTVLILEMLHQISEDRQIILFSQEDEVRSWAEESLNEPSDRLIQLSSGGVPVS